MKLLADNKMYLKVSHPLSIYVACSEKDRVDKHLPLDKYKPTLASKRTVNSLIIYIVVYAFSAVFFLPSHFLSIMAAADMFAVRRVKFSDCLEAVGSLD